MQKIFNSIGTTLYSLRFIMAFFYLGLFIVILSLLYKFGIEVWHLVPYISSTELPKTDLIIKALELVDATMVAQLVWVVMLAGFSLFVANDHFANGIKKPEWLNDVNTYNLKLKLSFAIISISGIYALKAYLQGTASKTELLMTTGIHVLFVLSALGMAYSEYITKKTHSFETENATEH